MCAGLDQLAVLHPNLPSLDCAKISMVLQPPLGTTRLTRTEAAPSDRGGPAPPRPREQAPPWPRPTGRPRPRPLPILPGAPIACRDHRFTQAVVSISAPIGDPGQTMAEKIQKRWVCLKKAYSQRCRGGTCSWSPMVRTEMVSYLWHSALLVP